MSDDLTYYTQCRTCGYQHLLPAAPLEGEPLPPCLFCGHEEQEVLSRVTWLAGHLLHLPHDRP